jgi:hypothetical protein
LVATEVRTFAHDNDPRGVWAVPWGAGSLLSVHVDHDFGVGSETIYDQRFIRRYVPNPDFFSWAHTPNTQDVSDWIYYCPDVELSAQRQMPCRRATTGDYWFVTGAPRSSHAAGVNALSLDGHVGYLVDIIDELVNVQMVSTNDGVSLNVSEYVR